MIEQETKVEPQTIKKLNVSFAHLQAVSISYLRNYFFSTVNFCNQKHDVGAQSAMY